MEKELKLYYTDPLEAVYMASEFGVKFTNRIALYYEYKDQVFVDQWRNQGPYYIHPDSYHIFEPRAEDFVSYDDGIYAEFYSKKQWDLYGHKIIQRNSKPFFMPESK